MNVQKEFEKVLKEYEVFFGKMTKEEAEKILKTTDKFGIKISKKS